MGWIWALTAALAGGTAGWAARRARRRLDWALACLEENHRRDARRVEVEMQLIRRDLAPAVTKGWDA